MSVLQGLTPTYLAAVGMDGETIPTDVCPRAVIRWGVTQGRAFNRSTVVLGPFLRDVGRVKMFRVFIKPEGDSPAIEFPFNRAVHIMCGDLIEWKSAEITVEVVA
jgi:hypothetical protein